MIRFPALGQNVKILPMSSDVKMTDEPEQHDRKPGREAASRSREVRAGHLPVSEFASGIIGASAPFGRSDFPLPIESIHYEHPEPVPVRVLEDERR